MSCIFFQTLKGRLPKYRGTWIKAPEGVCGSGCEIWTLEEHSGSELQWLYLQKQRDQRHQQITHLSIVTGNSCRTNTPFIIKNSINHQSINQWMIWNQTFRKQTSLALIISSMSLIVCERAEMCLFISSSFSFIICFFCSSSSLSAVIVASSSSLRNWWSFSNCCLIWRSVCSAWDWNQITFTSIISINTHQHIIIQIQEKHPTYNRSRSRPLLIIYNNNNLDSITLNITNHNYVGLKKPIYCYLSLLLFFWD